MAHLRVEIFYDHEVSMWGYGVPILNIVGTGCRTREDAERYVLDAIEFTLEEEIEDLAEDAEVVTYELTLTRAS